MNEVKKQSSIDLIVVITLVTSFLEVAYGYFYTKTNNNGYVLIWEALAFFVLQAMVLLILKLTKVLSKQRNLDIYIGVAGLTHSLFMALLVTQRVSANIETTFFVLGLFIIIDVMLLLLWEFIYRRNRKKEHNTPKTFGRKQRITTAVLSFVGAFLVIFLARIFDHNIIIFDVLISLLSVTYTVFGYFLKSKKTTNDTKQADC